MSLRWKLGTDGERPRKVGDGVSLVRRIKEYTGRLQRNTSVFVYTCIYDGGWGRKMSTSSYNTRYETRNIKILFI